MTDMRCLYSTAATNYPTAVSRSPRDVEVLSITVQHPPSVITTGFW